MINLLKRFITQFDVNDSKVYDVVIVGTGVAGLYTSVCLDRKLKIALITKEKIQNSNTTLAQGGIAAPISHDDSPEIHFNDTINAGAGLCNEEMVKILVNEAVDNINNLISMEIPFDLDEEGEIILGKEGAHSKNRIVHASGDATGRIISDHLSSIVQNMENVDIIEDAFFCDVLTNEDTAVGVVLKIKETVLKIYANYIIIATGGYGYIYNRTTNPPVTTGDGIAAALRAGCELADMEFVQFHPTVLIHPLDSSFLISEAVRGEGAILLNNKNERFMDKYTHLKELAPRDVVARAIYYEMQKTNSTNVFLDITFKDKDFLMKRFPNIYKRCEEIGIDISKDKIPVSPAQHYCMGGIISDKYGKTNIGNLFVCGEASCTMVHGANRLASNSLLEGLVFGRRIANYINNSTKGTIKHYDIKHKFKHKEININIQDEINSLKRNMDLYVGIIRDKNGLTPLLNQLSEKIYRYNDIMLNSRNQFEFYNMLTIAWTVTYSALQRTESRGSHFRADYPEIDNNIWKKHIIINKLILEGI